jgi:hypothetical protein
VRVDKVIHYLLLARYLLRAQEARRPLAGNQGEALVVETSIQAQPVNPAESRPNTPEVTAAFFPYLAGLNGFVNVKRPYLLDHSRLDEIPGWPNSRFEKGQNM